MTDRRATALIVLLLLALPCAILYSVSSGVLNIPLPVSLQALGHFFALPVAAVDPQQQMVLQAIRWPRTLMAALVGACLAMCGAAMQGLFRNALADPSLIGVSSGASLGASIAIVLGSTVLAGASELLGANSAVLTTYLVAIMAFAGGFIATIFVYRLGTSGGATSVATMLLAGIAITAVAGAISNIFSFIADDLALRRISLWRMGSLDGANWQQLTMALSLIGLVLIALPRYSRELNALLLGESEAGHLGIDVQRVKLQIIAWTALGVGVAVSVSGVIGFVGLIVPHLVRLLIGPDHRRLLPASALMGASLLVVSDTIARTVMAPVEIPIGIVTALLGAPFFISLLLQQRQKLALL